MTCSGLSTIGRGFIITATIGVSIQTSMDCYLAAYRGQEQLCRDLVRTTIGDSTALGRGFRVATTLCAAAILHNGLGQYSETLAAANEGAEYDNLGMLSTKAWKPKRRRISDEEP